MAARLHALGWFVNSLSQLLKADGGVDEVAQDELCGVGLAVEEFEPFVVHNDAMLPKLSAAFYAQQGSDPPSQPVRDWLKGLPKAERVEVGGDIQSVQFGWPFFVCAGGMQCKAL